MSDVLLLNANAVPVSLLPLSVISWQDAVRYLWLDLVVVLHEYENWQVHSPSITITVPAVVMLRKQVRFAGQSFAPNTRPQANLIFLRDRFRCAYCLRQFPRRQLTIDHVTPLYYGGETTYENVCAACAACNSARGHDTTIQPKRQPFRPTLQHLIAALRTFPIVIAHASWNLYLKWDDELVTISRD